MRKAIIQFFGGNIFSKVLGLAREVLVATLFGTGQIIGAYRIAQTGTLVPVNFFTSDSLNAVFIPLYKCFRSEAKDKAQALFWSLLVVFTVFSLLLTAGLWWVSASWVAILAPGLGLHTILLATEMVRVMSLGVPFYLLSSLVTFLAMGNDDFVPMVVRAPIQNIGLIAGAVLAFALHNAIFFAWGFTVSYIAFSLWIGVHANRAGFLALPISRHWPRIGEVLHAFWIALKPLLLLPIMLQGNIVIERVVATLISLAAVSALDYARFISDTIIFLVSVPIAITGLSNWSGLDAKALQQRLNRLLPLMLLIVVPISTFLAVHSQLVVEVLYARRAFGVHSVTTTADILFGISLGIWAQSIAYVLIKALNTQFRNRAVVLVMAAALSINVVFNLALYPYLGAMTLGLANAAYGLVLLGGTLTALQLWKNVLSQGWVIAIIAAGYLILSTLLPLPENKWVGLATAGGYALAYWLLCVVSIPYLRRSVIDVLSFNRGRS